MLNNDKVGLLLFTDRVEQYIPPQKGRTHLLRLIRDVIEFQPQGRGTSIIDALVYLNGADQKKGRRLPHLRLPGRRVRHGAEDRQPQARPDRHRHRRSQRADAAAAAATFSSRTWRAVAAFSADFGRPALRAGFSAATPAKTAGGCRTSCASTASTPWPSIPTRITRSPSSTCSSSARKRSPDETTVRRSLFLALSLPAGAAQVTLSASTSTATIGERIELRVVVRADAGVSDIRVQAPPGAYESSPATRNRR